MEMETERLAGTDKEQNRMGSPDKHPSRAHSQAGSGGGGDAVNGPSSRPNPSLNRGLVLFVFGGPGELQ